MRTRLVPVLAGLIILGTATSGPVGAASMQQTVAKARVCASYLTQDTFGYWTSQNFEASMDEYDGVAADDLEVSRRCRARALTVVGQYNDTVDPVPDSETVTFYRERGGVPGRVISSQTVVGQEVGWGSFEIVLDRAVRLRPGRPYWMSVQVNLDWSPNGDLWGWELRAPAAGSQGMWMNPGDGFATGCVDWTSIAICSSGSWDGDFMFEVRTR